MSGLSRRRFLGATAGVVGALTAPRISVGEERPSAVDVAVVGGGMSGLFCAMRLRGAGVDVALFEASDRLGGRVMSVLLPGFSEQAAEIGAMRLRSTDAVAIKLVDTLLGPDAKVDFDYPTHAWFLRDRLLRALDDPSEIPYGLDAAERAIVSSGNDLLVETVRELARSSGTTNLPAAAHQGFWQQILKVRSKEGRNFIVDSLGYTSLTFNWNVRAALSWFEDDFAPGTTYFNVRGGLQRVTDAVAAAYARDGGFIYANHSLRLIQRSSGGGLGLTFDTMDGSRQVSAGRVILALTPAAMEDLDSDSLILRDARFRTALKGVLRLPLGKIHLSFDRPWWQSAGYGVGRTVTDIPARQTYLWGKDAKSGMALTVASYHDGPAIEFWQALDTGETYGPAKWIDAARGVDRLPLPASLVESLPASRPMVEEIWYQLKKTHDLPDSVPPPLLGTYRNWGADPLYGAGFHLWAIGTDSEQTIDYMREPFPGLHIVGEAWSRDQGWIRGATATAETVLQEKFGLPPYLSE